MTWTETVRKSSFLAVFGLFVLSGCAGRELEVLEPDLEVVTDESYVIYDTADVTVSIDETYPVPDDWAIETPCPCKYVKVCQGAVEDRTELEALLDEMKKEAGERTEAAALAVMEVGPDLMEYEDWKDLVVGAMEMLSSPTIVVVQMQDGVFKKVKLEEVSEMDIDLPQVFTIKAQVSAKMKAALKAHLVSYGVDSVTAKKLSSHMMDTYLAEL